MKNLIIACIAFVVVANVVSCKKAEITPQTTATIDSLKVGLIAYYQMNNTGADSSGKGNDISFYRNITSTTNRFGLVNSAFGFDGSSSYAVVNDNSALRLNNTDFTLNVWVNMISFNPTNGSFIFAKRTSGLNDGWGFSITGVQSGVGLTGGVYFGPGGGNPYALSTKAITTNKWNMITVVYNLAKQQVSIYINGVFDSATSNIATPNAAIASNFYIGTDNPANSTSYFMNGSFDDMRIYNRALSLTLIQKLLVSTN